MHELPVCVDDMHLWVNFPKIQSFQLALFQSENALNSSLDLVNAKNSQLQAIVDFYQALGGGWQ